jgi:hypothetical protein
VEGSGRGRVKVIAYAVNIEEYHEIRQGNRIRGQKSNPKPTEQKATPLIPQHGSFF